MRRRSVRARPDDAQDFVDFANEPLLLFSRQTEFKFVFRPAFDQDQDFCWIIVVARGLLDLQDLEFCAWRGLDHVDLLLL